MSKNKLIVQWTRNSNSSSDSESQVRRTRSMSRATIGKEKPEVAETETKKCTKPKGKVEKVEKEGEPGEEIMRQFLKERDESKWTFFVDKLGKKDSDVLKRLLLSKGDSECESDSKSKPEKRKYSDTDSDEKVRRSERKRKERKIEIVKVEDSDSSDSKKKKGKKTEDKPGKFEDGDAKKKKETKNEDKPIKIDNEDSGKKKKTAVKVEDSDSDTKKKKEKKTEEKPVKVESSDTDGKNVKKVKKENSGDVKDEKEEKLEKEYYVFINGKKQLVRLISEDERLQPDCESDSSIKEDKLPKTLKPFYSVSSSDENDTKKKNLNQLDGNGDSSIVSVVGTISMGSSVEEIGDKISLAPASSTPSYVTYSDTTETLNQTISETLSEVFEMRGHYYMKQNETVQEVSKSRNAYKSNDSNGTISDSNDRKFDSNAQRVGSKDQDLETELPRVKKWNCDKCTESFFKMEGLICHYKHAHYTDSDTECRSTENEEIILINSTTPSSSDEIEEIKEVEKIVIWRLLISR